MSELNRGLTLSVELVSPLGLRTHEEWPVAASLKLVFDALVPNSEPYAAELAAFAWSSVVKPHEFLACDRVEGIIQLRHSHLSDCAHSPAVVGEDARLEWSHWKPQSNLLCDLLQRARDSRGKSCLHTKVGSISC